MSISGGIPAIGGPNADALGLNGAGLSGVAGPLLANPNAQSPPLPVLLSGRGLAVEAGTATSANSAASGLDPLTPRGLNATGTLALSNVISAVSATLDNIPASAAAGFTQVLQSPGFQLLLQVLGAGDSGPAATLSTQTESDSPASANSASTSALPQAEITNLPENIDSSQSTPYFQKLLGELESAYKAVPGADAATNPATGSAALAPALTSELDLFLKWLALNGASSVAANA